MGDELTKVFSLLRTPDEAGSAPPAAKTKSSDWSASLGLVQQTAEALRASAERVRQMEERTQAVLQRVAKELQNAHARIDALETRLRASEAREQDAEARARDAEEWLHRIHEAMAEELPSSLSLLQSATESSLGRSEPA